MAIDVSKAGNNTTVVLDHVTEVIVANVSALVSDVRMTLSMTAMNNTLRMAAINKGANRTPEVIAIDVLKMASNVTKIVSHAMEEHLIEISDADEVPTADAPQVSVVHPRLYVFLACVTAGLLVALVWTLRPFGYRQYSRSHFQRLIDDARTPKRFGRSQSQGQIPAFF